jgi:hypothetical protein
MMDDSCFVMTARCTRSNNRGRPFASFAYSGSAFPLYGITEKQLLGETGDDPRNPTLGIDCRTVFSTGQKQIDVIGPIPEVAEAVLEPHRTYWTQKS